jgi:hypothetical protein
MEGSEKGTVWKEAVHRIDLEDLRALTSLEGRTSEMLISTGTAILLFDTRTGQTLSSLTLEEHATKLVQVRPDLVLGASESNAIMSFRVTSSEVSLDSRAATTGHTTFFARYSAELFICSYEHGLFEIREVVGLKLIDSWMHPTGSGTWDFFLLDQVRLVARYGNAGIAVWNMDTHTIEKEIPVPDAYLNDVRYLKSEMVLGLGTYGGDAIFLDPTNYLELRTIAIKEVILCLLEYSPGIVLYHVQGGLVIFDPKSGKHKRYPAAIESNEEWSILGNGNLVTISSGCTELTLLDINAQNWNFMEWIFLGHIDLNSVFYNLPVEIIFNFVQLASPLQLFLELNNFWEGPQ